MDLTVCVEAHLTGILLEEKSKQICVSLLLLDGKRATLRADCVDRCVANEFRERNIIDRVSLWDKNSSSEDFYKPLAGLLSGKSEIPVDDAFLPVINCEIEAIKTGQKVLIEIEAIYGASIVMLAERISIEFMADS